MSVPGAVSVAAAAPPSSATPPAPPASASSSASPSPAAPATRRRKTKAGGAAGVEGDVAPRRGQPRGAKDAKKRTAGGEKATGSGRKNKQLNGIQMTTAVEVAAQAAQAAVEAASAPHKVKPCSGVVPDDAHTEAATAFAAANAAMCVAAHGMADAPLGALAMAQHAIRQALFLTAPFMIPLDQTEDPQYFDPRAGGVMSHASASAARTGTAGVGGAGAAAGAAAAQGSSQGIYRPAADAGSGNVTPGQTYSAPPALLPSSFSSSASSSSQNGGGGAKRKPVRGKQRQRAGELCEGEEDDESDSDKDDSSDYDRGTRSPAGKRRARGGGRKR